MDNLESELKYFSKEIKTDIQEFKSFCDKLNGEFSFTRIGGPYNEYVAECHLKEPLEVEQIMVSKHDVFIDNDNLKLTTDIYNIFGNIITEFGGLTMDVFELEENYGYVKFGSTPNFNLNRIMMEIRGKRADSVQLHFDFLW